MAKQCGEHTITGCYGNLCFYAMEGNYYVRMKSSLTGKRVKNDPAFAGTMRYAKLLGMAAKIASVVYKQMDKTQKAKGVYRQLTGAAMRMLKQGEYAAAVQQKLAAAYLAEQSAERKAKNTTTKQCKRMGFADALLAAIFDAEVMTEADVATPVFEAAPT